LKADYAGSDLALGILDQEQSGLFARFLQSVDVPLEIRGVTHCLMHYLDDDIADRELAYGLV
jgi:hypothetical protein